MKTNKSLLWVLSLIIIVWSCQKEKSFENGPGSTSAGSLQAGGTGDCLGSAVAGTYKKDTALGSANYVDVKVDVTTAGTYTISTDTINGFFFKGTGTFSATGVSTVRLQGTGKPAAEGTNIFTVTYDSTQCTFSVLVIPGSTGGTAVYALQGSPNNCVPGTTQGTYTEGMPTSTNNTAIINVDVTSVGTYSIVTTAVNGIIFSASGTFSSPGAQAIVLNANGTPTAAGSFTIPVTLATTNCSFPLTVAAAVIDYFPRVVDDNWSYRFDNNSSDTVYQNVITQTQSALGNTYNVFMFDDGSSVDTLGYYRKTTAGDYFQYLDLGFFFGLDHEIWGEYIFLKDYAAVNDTWTSAVFSDTYTDSTGTFPISVRFKETIQQKDVPVTVQSTAYQNVIIVKEEYEYSFDSGATWTALPFSSLNYYARNIGLIKLEFTDASGAGNSYLQELTRYQVF